MLLWTECVCDRCSKTNCGEFAEWGKRSAIEIKTELRKDGWIYINKKLFCKECKEKYSILRV